jgi:hypothetical protein
MSEKSETTGCGLVQTTSHRDQIDYDCRLCGYTWTGSTHDRAGPECPRNSVRQHGTPTQLFGGADMRCETLVQAMRATLYERGSGLPLPLILGAIRILEHQILKEAHDG